jgi:hypothetical protein
MGRGNEVTITNDGATILKSIYVDNPAAKVLVGGWRGSGSGCSSWGPPAADVLPARQQGRIRGQAVSCPRGSAAPKGQHPAAAWRTSSPLPPCPHPPAPAPTHPADISRVQDEEVGDGTTSVVVLAGELLREAELLVNQKVHPMTIIAGFRWGWGWGRRL